MESCYKLPGSRNVSPRLAFICEFRISLSQRRGMTTNIFHHHDKCVYYKSQEVAMKWGDLIGSNKMLPNFYNCILPDPVVISV